MCGRLNVIDDVLTQFVSDILGLEFCTPTNIDLRPSQMVSTIIHPDSFTQINANWGIKPSWSKQLLINAKSESVWKKSTFCEAFSHSRCLIPCNGWYEWQTIAGQKQKYSFQQSNETPVFMGGMLYDIDAPKLVTLTAEPNDHCAKIHHRMPVLIAPDKIDTWFGGSPSEVSQLMATSNLHQISYQKLKN